MATEKEHTPMEKLVCIRMQFVRLLNAKIPEPYYSNVEQCLKWCRDLEDHLTTIDESEDDDNENH